jgi:hypothetical protein
MAFVTLATTTTTGLTALTSYFLPIDGTQYSSQPYSLVDFISGSEYYVEGNQYTANNALKIDNASSKLNKVRWIIGGGANPYSNFFSWATGDAQATTINFALFPNLSSLNFEGNGRINTMDLRGVPMRSIGMWAAGPLSAFYTTNIQWWDGGSYGNIDLRQSALSTVDISGCRINSLNLSDNQLSAFDFKLGDDNKAARVTVLSVGRNPFKPLAIDFNNCDTRLLSGVETFKFSRWNNFSQGIQSGNEEPYKLKSMTIAGPLSSLTTLDVSQNNLSSLNVPFIPNLRNLYIGERALQIETSADTPQRTLSAKNITFNSLTALQYLNMAGIGPINKLSDITGMDQLSSLNILDAQNNSSLNGVSFTDLDLNVIPGRQLQRVGLANCTALTGVTFGNQPFDQRPISNPGFPTFISPTFALYNCPAISSVDASSLSGIFDLYFDIVPELRTLITPLTSNVIASITVTQAPYMKDLLIPQNLTYLLRIESCPALTGLVLDNNYNFLSLRIIDAPSNLQFAGCSALQEIYIDRTDTRDINLSRLSACRTFTCYKNTNLSSIIFSPSFNVLRYIDLKNNSNLSSINIQDYANLTTVTISGNKASNINIKNNITLSSINIYDELTSPLSSIDCGDNLNLRQFFYNFDNATLNIVSNVSSFNFTNCYSLSNISNLKGANIRNLDSVKPLNRLTNLSIDSLPLSSLDALNYMPSLTTLSFTNTLRVTGCSPLVTLDSYNNPAGIQSARFNNIYTLTSADTFIRNLPYKCQSLLISSNRLQTLDTAPFSALNLRIIDIRTNQLSSAQIDSLLIALDNNSVTPTGTKNIQYTGNVTNRSRVSNAARANLVTKGWGGTGAVAIRATPNVYIAPVPETLQMSETADILSTASYLGSSVPTYVIVLSGPGVVTGNTLSAFDSTGVITVAISSADTFYYQPISAVYHIQAVRYDVSPYITFTGLNKTYTSNVISASASVPSYSLSAQLYYYQNGVSVTPLAAGYYTVSAVVSDKDYYGTTTETLSVLNTADFYSVPTSATSSVIYFPRTVDTEKDVVITFDYAFYGTELSGSEGFCVSFTDATAFRTPISGGAPGKALNYTNLTLVSADDGTFTFENYPGKFRGSLGIGFDATGNFALTSLNVPGLPDTIPNSISIRDGASNSYNVLYRSEVLTGSSYKVPFNLYESTTSTPTFKTVRVRLTNLGRKVLVDMKPTSAYEFVNYVNYDLPVAQPSIGSVALSYSTGNNNPTFKIKNFNLNCFFKSATATLADLFTASFTGPGTYGANGLTYTTSYELTLYYDIKTPTGLPYTMNLYINTTPVANVLFDPIYQSQLFAAVNTLRTYYSYFVSGGNYLV